MNTANSQSDTHSTRDEFRVMAMNRGSSSLKLAIYVFSVDRPPSLLLTGKVDRIGSPQASLAVDYVADGHREEIPVEARGHGEASGHLLDWLHMRLGLARSRPPDIA